MGKKPKHKNVQLELYQTCSRLLKAAFTSLLKCLVICEIFTCVDKKKIHSYSLVSCKCNSVAENATYLTARRVAFYGQCSEVVVIRSTWNVLYQMSASARFVKRLCCPRLKFLAKLQMMRS